MNAKGVAPPPSMGRDGSTEALNLAALARVKESKLVRLKAAGSACDATVPLCAARIAGTTASKGSKGSDQITSD